MAASSCTCPVGTAYFRIELNPAQGLNGQPTLDCSPVILKRPSRLDMQHFNFVLTSLFPYARPACSLLLPLRAPLPAHLPQQASLDQRNRGSSLSRLPAELQNHAQLGKRQCIHSSSSLYPAWGPHNTLQEGKGMRACGLFAHTVNYPCPGLRMYAA